MAVNPMQRKSRNSFLLGIIVTLLITGVVIVILFLQLKKKDDALKAEIGSKQTVYTLNMDVKSGQILTEDMFETKKININEIPSNATSIQEVIDSWFLQTRDGKQIYRDADGLYIKEADNIVELTYENGQYYKNDGESVSLRNDPYTYDLEDGEKLYFASSNTIENDVTRLYEDLYTGNVYTYKIENGAITKEYLTLNSVPLLAKIDMNANTVITPELVVQSDSAITDDVRTQEYNMIELPIDLLTNDYIDIRLMLPSGQNFIVVSKKQVEIPVNNDGTYVADTIRINLREDEILALSSAIVEAYGIPGAKLYVNKYVEPGIQNGAVPTYVPNAAVTAELGPVVDQNGRLVGFSNQNLVDMAMEELKQRYSNASLRNDYLQSIINNTEEYNENIQEGMDEGVTNSIEARQKYLESLNYKQ